MARKLKTYQTTAGFFDLAVAVPSMKAALQAWGSKHNLFQMGFARELKEPDVIEATCAKPGVVLRRAVGTKARFSETPTLPDFLPDEDSKPSRQQKTRRAASKADTISEAKIREREQRRKTEYQRQVEQRLKEASARKTAEISAVEAELRQAEAEHRKLTNAIAEQRQSLDRQEAAEEARWQKQRAALEADVRRRKNCS